MLLVRARFIQKYYSPLVKTFRMDSASLINSVKACIPPLDGGSHKGEAGRIGVIGGSLEYTGAPYFAGISALKVGADLVHVFCTIAAASVIKSYSPELIVHPLLDQPNAIQTITPWLDRLHVLVIGPGLGRDAGTFSVVSQLINITREKRIPLVIDADGLFLITENPGLIKDYPSPGVILTPNKIEYERLMAKFQKGSNKTVDLDQFGAHVTILRKGQTDELYSPSSDLQWASNLGGSGRRCGGQGDILSGSIATFLHWTLNNKQNETEKPLAAASMSCFAASKLVRLCNEKAFKVKGRSMLASDMIEFIHVAFEELFDQ